MADPTLVMTEAGFITEFLNQHSQRADRPFCFVLGAGVSRKSGIPTGGEIADVWLWEIYEAENFDDLTLEAWATPERLGILGFDTTNLARFYPQLYSRRYGVHEEAGYAFLESQMEGKEPSYGYSVLAYLLSETSHRVVVTTNFDNLVADALSIHSSRFPLVVGHDALARFAAVELRRPLVAKVHGALGFSPKSQPSDITDLPEGWCAALPKIFSRYTPIVIGYEGNDGSLMGFLRLLPEGVPDRVLWCVYAPDAKPAECLQRVSVEVCDYVRARRGRLVPIRGFDELMAKLLSRLREKGSVPDLYERLKQRARDREESYDDQQRELFAPSVPSKRADGGRTESMARHQADPVLSQAASEIAESRKDKPWWVWLREANSADTPDATEAIYQRAVEALPESADMLRSYALFLDAVRKDADRAEALYRQALAADPQDSLSLAFYANFLEMSRGDMDMAEQYYRRALEAGPLEVYTLTEYASFLRRVRNDMDKAEEYLHKAVGAEPENVGLLRSYAEFLREERKDRRKAARLEQRADAIVARRSKQVEK